MAWAQLWNGSRPGQLEPPATPSAPTPAELSGVSCVSSRACVAVGEYRDATGVKATLAVSWDGSRWTVQPTPNAATGFEGSNELASVSCLSRRFCMAVVWSVQEPAAATSRPAGRRMPLDLDENHPHLEASGLTS